MNFWKKNKEVRKGLIEKLEKTAKNESNSRGQITKFVRFRQILFEK